MTWTRYSPGGGPPAEAAGADWPPAARYCPAWPSWTASWESIAPSWADERPLMNSQAPRAKIAAAATANATARRSRIGMPLPGSEPVTHAPDRLEIVPPERRVDLPPQVVDVLVDEVRPAVISEIPHRVDDLRA